MKQYYGENQGEMGYGAGTDMEYLTENEQDMGYSAEYGKEIGYTMKYEQQMGNQGEETFIEEKGRKRKKKKKEMQPQCYISVTNMPTWNYKVYYMSKKEKIVYFLLAFLVGGFVGYVFFGGLFKDEFYSATIKTYISNIAVIFIFGILFGKVYLPMRTEQLKEKKKRLLKLQFRDMLESLTTSLNAGSNTIDAFQNVYEDLKVQYGEEADIVYEISIILSGIRNNHTVEEMLKDFGWRSGVDDIMSFSQVFEICYRKGGNIKDIVRNTHSILSDKMRISEDIETQITAAKNENNIMIVMPVILIGMIKSMSPDFASNFASISGVIATLVSLGLFILSYIIGRKLMEIKI